MQSTTENEIIYEMMIENTGTNILDSGGAYGRNWERNQGKSLEDFISSPIVRTDKYFGPVLSTFHYLSESLVYDEEKDKEFQEWLDLPENENVHYLGLMEEWAKEHDESKWNSVVSDNTYNVDNILNQDFQYTQYEDEYSDTIVLLQIHGGCDIRGGYTRPKLFIASEMFGYDIDSYYLTTGDDRKGDPVTIDYRGGEWYHFQADEAFGHYPNSSGERNPMYKWVDFDNLEYDDEVGRFKCPDGDGHIIFGANFYY